MAPVMQDIEQATREHCEALIRYAWTCTGSLEEAQDIVQNALVSAMLSLRKGHRPNNLKAWLFGIAHHEVCRSKRRQNGLRRKLTALLERGRPAPGADPMLEELREAIAKLPEPYGPILALRFVESFSVEEIAELTDRPPTTVKVYLSRGLGLLRERLGGKPAEFRKKAL